MSNWQGVLSPGELACWQTRLAGAIVGCQRPVIARDQIRRLRAAGVPVIGVYAFLYWGRGVELETQKALDVAAELGIDRVWLDCESSDDEDKTLTPSQRLSELHRCVVMVENAGREPGIYTGRWWWVPQMANSPAYSWLPLWHAAYYDDERPVATVDYGGWTDVELHQYTSTPSGGFCGRSSLDLNYWIGGSAAMTPEEKARLERVERLLAGNGWRGLVGEAALAEADRLELSALKGIDSLNDAQGAHAALPHQGGPHTHTAEVTLT